MKNFGERYLFDWLRIMFGMAGIALVIVSVAGAYWLLAAINAVCAFFLLGTAFHKSYWSVSRCPFCRARAPRHVNGCTSWYHSARWDG